MQVTYNDDGFQVVTLNATELGTLLRAQLILKKIYRSTCKERDLAEQGGVGVAAVIQSLTDPDPDISAEEEEMIASAQLGSLPSRPSGVDESKYPVTAAEAATDVVVDSGDSDNKAMASAHLKAKLAKALLPGECHTLAEEYVDLGLPRDSVDELVDSRIAEIKATRGENSNKGSDILGSP